MERISQKVGKIKEYLSIIYSLKDECEKRFRSDPVYRGALLHYLYLVADSSISLAEMIIKEKSLRPPQSYSDTFDILGESNILDKEFAFEFAKISGFRNFLAHDYEDVDPEFICHSILPKLKDVEFFIGEISKITR